MRNTVVVAAMFEMNSCIITISIQKWYECFVLKNTGPSLLYCAILCSMFQFSEFWSFTIALRYLLVRKTLNPENRSLQVQLSPIASISAHYFSSSVGLSLAIVWFFEFNHLKHILYQTPCGNFPYVKTGVGIAVVWSTQSFIWKKKHSSFAVGL